MDVVRSTLQPLTRNLPAPLFKAGLALLGPDCYKTIVLDITPESSPECVKLAISKGLGVGIVGASAVVKVPQILKLINAKSAVGVSFLSYLLETAALVVTLFYSARNGFPFSTYGETALIAAQNVVICSLVLKYSGQNAAVGGFLAALAAAAYALNSESLVDAKALGVAQAGAGILGVTSKIPQILAIWQQGGTGQLSAFAVGAGTSCEGVFTDGESQVFNYLAGSLSRIFTTLQEVDDSLILYGYIAGFLLNAVLAGQMVRAPPSRSFIYVLLITTPTDLLLE